MSKYADKKTSNITYGVFYERKRTNRDRSTSDCVVVYSLAYAEIQRDPKQMTPHYTLFLAHMTSPTKAKAD